MIARDKYLDRLIQSRDNDFVKVITGVRRSGKSSLLILFKQILLNPIPFWFIIILSAAGTFLSVYFGDELIDIAKHKDRKKHFAHKNKHIFLLASFGIVVLILIMYYVLLSELGISL